ncbi:PDR/VanB family oxidoreductase [Roseomonas sp. BN140053]|uniref:PDR/VanB family oxidoreductase n=1 Tax=Roseomonas sp. BN140053 TaxID=3391898 RepID=UPI0039ED8121
MRFDNQWTQAILRRVRDLTPGIREFTLAPEGGASPYPTGAHVVLRVIVDGKQDLRRYSLVGEQPMDGCYRIAVKREDPGRGGSRYMWSLPEGARIELAPPDSFFQLSRDASEYLLIAGGIGITPIRGMATALLRRGAKFRMLYGGRTREEMAYLGELEVELGDRLAVFPDDQGVRMDLAAEFARLAPDAEVYVCGPLGLLEAVKRAWAATGRPRAKLVFETFGSSGRFASEPFTVRVPRLGVEVQVPANTSMLDALEAAGVGVLYDCRRGECGLCAMDVLAVEGTMDHRDVFFSDHEHEENRKVCACVSRVAGGSITVDPAFRGDAGLQPGKSALWPSAIPAAE